MKIGYARVSSTGQSLEVQLDALREAGCRKVYSEKKSGKSRDKRGQLRIALDYIRDGDVLVVSKLDRLARSVLDLNQIAQELQSKGAGLIVLGQSIDTTSNTGRLLFNILGSIAEFERDLINERTAEGRAKAMARGVRFGRPEKLTDEQTKALREEFASWHGSKADLAERYGISRASLYRIAGEAAA